MVVLGGKIEFYVKYLRVQYNHKLEKYVCIYYVALFDHYRRGISVNKYILNNLIL